MLIAIILIIAAFIVGYFVGANNPLSSVKKKIIDKAKGLLVFLPLVLLLSSCYRYGDTITGQVVQTGDACHYRPMDSLTKDSADKGWVSIQTTDGNPLICRVDVKTEASWRQKLSIAWHKGGAGVSIVLLVFAVVSVVFAIIQGNKGGSYTAVIGPIVLAIILLCFSAASIGWAITKEFSMPKAVYDNPDARHAYEDANLYL